MRVFCTGSEGFIGTHLKERLLQEGHEVVGLDSLEHPSRFRNGEFIQGDILEIEKYYDLIKSCDSIIHLAAQINVENSLENPTHTLMTNTYGTLKLLEAATKFDIPILFASSTEIYGDMKDSSMNENHTMNPKSPYAAAKMGADGLCKAFYHSYGTKIIIIRNYNTFGKYQSDDKWGAVIAKFADKLIKNEAPIIFGDGLQKRDFMGYKDAIDFYMLMLKEGYKYYGHEFNVGMGKNISIKELANTMITLFDKQTVIQPVHIAPRPGEVNEFLCNNKKAKSTGWEPNTNLIELLKEYVDWKIKYDNN